MNPETDPDADGADPLLATRSDAFARIAGWFTLAVGTLVLLGWIVGSEHLKAAVPDIRGMKVNAALAFLLAGISLALQVRSRPGWPRAIARACAVGVLLIGALTLAEYVFVWRSGIDEWLFRDPASALPGWEPGRMPVLSALNFVLLGASLLLLDTALRHRLYPPQWLAVAVVFLALLPALGYTYGAHRETGIESGFLIGLRSALAFLVLAIGVLAARVEDSGLKLAIQRGIGGKIVRRLLPAAFALPIAIGSLRLLGEQSGLYETRFGVAIAAWSSVVILAAMIWWYAATLQREETLRRAEEQRFRSLLEGAPDAILIVDPAGVIRLVNAQTERAFGYPRAELLGQSVDLLVPEPARSAHSARRQDYLHHPTVRAMGRNHDLEAQRKDGSRFAVEISLSPIPRGEEVWAMAAIRDVSERKRAEAALRIAEGRAQSTLDALRSPICVVDAHGTIVACNRNWPEFGAADGARLQALGIGANYLEVCRRVFGPDGESAEALAAGMHAVLAHERDEFVLECPCHAPTPPRWFRVRVTRYAVDHAQWLVVAHEDITTHRVQEQKILRLNRVYAVLSGINGVIVRVQDRQRLFDDACRIAVEHGGFGVAWIDVLDPAAREIRPQAEACEDAERILHQRRPLALDDVAAQGFVARAFASGRYQVCNRLEEVSEFHTERLRDAVACGYRSFIALPLKLQSATVATLSLLSKEADFFDEAELRLLEELAADISLALDHIAQQEFIEHAALHDTLTGLPNTRLFIDRLQQRIQHAADGDGETKLAVAMFDLENFTWLNETHGRAFGDRVLREVAERLVAMLPPGCTGARVGGDTFAIGGDCPGEAASATTCQQLLARIGEPLLVDGREIRLSAHAGIALYPRDADSAEALFERAEAALRQAKATRQRLVYFAPEANVLLAERLALEADLHAALEHGQFALVFQPKIDLASGEVIGAEALIRWRHPRRGLIAPADFIGIAEDSRRIVAIGDWVLRTVCAQQAAWLAAGVDVVPVMINVSPVQIAHDDVFARVQRALAAHGLEARHIELELTESAALHDSDATRTTLAALRKLGVCLSLDDFGTGYASLEQIRRFPIDYVKIDRRFVANATTSAESSAIVIIAMSHALQLRVVAEGVETEAQLAFLRRHGCDEMQGFYFSPPLPAAAFEAMLRSGARASLPEPEPEERASVLIVDDEVGVRSALSRVLRRDGYRILTAPSGEAALELLAMHRVQLVIADQRMPGMGGAEFLDAVKRLHPDTVRIILSGYTDLASITEAVNRGAVYKFLTKPWDDEELREQVRDALRHYRPASG